MTFHSVYRSMAAMPAALLTSLSLRHAQLLSRRVAAISMMALRRASPQSLAIRWRSIIHMYILGVTGARAGE